MKSEPEKLKKRGFLDSNEEIENFKSLSTEQLLYLLNSKKAIDRTIAARVFSTKDLGVEILISRVIPRLLNRLSIERAIYTKIEICNTLKSFGNISVKFMIPYLGKIGDNQYKELPNEKFNKKNYPLPRDIIARTIAHMNIGALYYIRDIVTGDDIVKIREAIDAIGFLCFYNRGKFNKINIIKRLVYCLNIHHDDDIIRWKIVRAFESFDDGRVIHILRNVVENEKETAIIDEAKRSLKIIESRR